MVVPGFDFIWVKSIGSFFFSFLFSSSFLIFDLFELLFFLGSSSLKLCLVKKPLLNKPHPKLSSSLLLLFELLFLLLLVSFDFLFVVSFVGGGSFEIGIWTVFFLFESLLFLSLITPILISLGTFFSSIPFAFLNFY